MDDKIVSRHEQHTEVVVNLADEQLRRSQLIDYENIAGHDGMRSSKSGTVIVKPCKQAEIDFYQSTFGHDKFRHWIPLYMGTLELQQVAEPRPSHSRAASQNLLIPGQDNGGHAAWTPSGGGKITAEHGVVLENVAYGFTKPNILDVKLGRRLWADDAPPAKRQKLDNVASSTTSEPLGYRIAGMKTFVGHTSPKADNIDGYRKYDKGYGRSLRPQDVRQAFADYFFIESAGITFELGSRVIRGFLTDLKALQEVLKAEESRMYSSSLLFVYEGDSKTLQRDLETASPTPTPTPSDAGFAGLVRVVKPAEVENALDSAELDFSIAEKITATQTKNGADEVSSVGDSSSDESESPDYKVQALKMIDFAHAAWTPGQGPDENTLFGIGNVIKILEDMIREDVPQQ